MTLELLEALSGALQQHEQRERCAEHPANLLQHVRCVDTETGEDFLFHLHEPDSGWYFQRELLDMWLSSPKSIVLKARQLGVTWLAGGLALWHLLYRPGTRSLVISFNEKEASKVVRRVWSQFQSLPAGLRNDVTVLKPAHGHEASQSIELKHPNGKISTLLGLPSTATAGRGETAALVILDEFAFHEYAADTLATVLPTAAKGGRILVISTANGVSNEQTGEGNQFHRVWVNAEDTGFANRFYGWRTHPERDDDFYRREVMAIPDAVRRAREYPNDPEEAFRLTGHLYFDEEALSWYAREATRDHLYRAMFLRHGFDKAKFTKSDLGVIRVYREPEKDHEYAIAADISTGRGKDFTAAYVVDLTDMALCAELRGKLDADQTAFQLHYLGRWYNTALIAVETGGGYGEAPIVLLRDGSQGRPPYPKMYRHRQFSRSDRPEHKPFGFPTNVKTRPLILQNLQMALREHALPWVTGGLMKELSTFVHRTTGTSPAAQEGCNDDRVLACAVVLELYRQFGFYPDRLRKRASRPRQLYPWLPGKK